MMEELSFVEMKDILGGISPKKYCQLLRGIIKHNDLDDGARDGAAYGWNRAGCGRYYNDVVM